MMIKNSHEKSQQSSTRVNALWSKINYLKIFWWLHFTKYFNFQLTEIRNKNPFLPSWRNKNHLLHVIWSSINTKVILANNLIMNEIIVVKIIIKITVVKNLNGRSGLKQNSVWHDGISLLPTRKPEQKNVMTDIITQIHPTLFQILLSVMFQKSILPIHIFTWYWIKIVHNM